MKRVYGRRMLLMDSGGAWRGLRWLFKIRCPVALMVCWLRFLSGPSVTFPLLTVGYVSSHQRIRPRCAEEQALGEPFAGAQSEAPRRCAADGSMHTYCRVPSSAHRRPPRMAPASTTCQPSPPSSPSHDPSRKALRCWRARPPARVAGGLPSGRGTGYGVTRSEHSRTEPPGERQSMATHQHLATCGPARSF